MSRFQPHVSRDRDTSKGKSDFANVLTEGWANIFEPFVPLVCTVTSSGGGGGYVEAPLRGHIFSFFFFFSPLRFFSSLFFTRWKNNGEQRAFEKRCACYASIRVNVGWKMCGVAGGKQEGWNCYSTWFPAKWRSSSLRDRMNWKIPFSKIHYSTSGWPVGKRGKREKDETAFPLEILSKSMESRGMKSVWRFDRETRAKRVIWREKKRNETREENRRRAVIKN